MKPSRLQSAGHKFCVFMVIFCFSIGVISFYSILNDLGRVYLGFYSFYNIIAGRYEITDTTPIWWNVIRSNKLSHRDGIIEINGYPAEMCC